MLLTKGVGAALLVPLLRPKPGVLLLLVVGAAGTGTAVTGARVGRIVGRDVGRRVGMFVGWRVGMFVGAGLGAELG